MTTLATDPKKQMITEKHGTWKKEEKINILTYKFFTSKMKKKILF